MTALEDLIARVTSGRFHDLVNQAADGIRMAAPPAGEDDAAEPNEQELKLAFITDHPGFDLLVGNPLYRMGDDLKPIPTEWVIAYATRTATDGSVETYEASAKGLAATFIELARQIDGRR